ncbi:HNH endonuclease signature motif containing protein [Gryllotalpicola protaetiae]|uniref:HNH endonuclease n=1 Tax=Gryllotalpicola protaetiae TaxID=2419771 RepID=A0A387BUU9_9MICO|nr:HNH endonuclease signature motif containing protein [Gryllotalpicola protaetiae]AYG04880.1 HNH endonuclease [Gryllotalpicola protaetiae]
MSSVLASLESLAATVAGALPCADDLATLTPEDEARATQVLGGIRSSVVATISLLAADIERKSARELGTEGLAQKRGFKDGVGLVQNLTGVGRDEAVRLVRVGGLLETAQAVAPVHKGDDPPFDAGERSIAALAALPGAWDVPVAVAVRNRWLSAAQGDALRQSLGPPQLTELAPAWRAAALELIGDCWSGQWTPEDLARAAKRVRASLDTLAAVREAEHCKELRSFKRFVRASGMVHYDIELDPESDARFYGPIRTMLSPRLGGPRFRDAAEIARARELDEDPRSNEQLMADTVVDLVECGGQSESNVLLARHRPQVMVALTAADLKKARAAQAVFRAHHAGDHSHCPGAALGLNCAGPDQGIAWIDGSDTPITATDAVRMLCGGGFTPVLFDETGQAIDVGKDQRLFTLRQRRAMAKRDGGCLWPDCPMPPDACEGHHDNPWAESSANHKTETRDGTLFCRRHHLMLHNHGARIERRGSQYWLLWPGRDPVLLHAKSGIRAQLRAQGGTR